MTVALGPKGNNLILGGRLNQVSAEEAYTVSRPLLTPGMNAHIRFSILPLPCSVKVSSTTAPTTC